jgi:sulfite exporter TauE/SafE
MAQLAAGVLIVVFGLAQLGVPGFRTITVSPPALANVLIPCGVTLSVEALALTSGSPWPGAATVAGARRIRTANGPGRVTRGSA